MSTAGVRVANLQQALSYRELERDASLGVPPRCEALARSLGLGTSLQDEVANPVLSGPLYSEIIAQRRSYVEEDTSVGRLAKLTDGQALTQIERITIREADEDK